MATLPNVDVTINASTITSGNLTFSNSTTATITVGTVNAGYLQRRYYPEQEPCGARRGGPDSKVFCEVFKIIPHTNHVGRGRTGKWFNWKDRPDG